MVIKWLVKLAKTNKICSTRWQVILPVDDSIAKKLFRPLLEHRSLFMSDVLIIEARVASYGSLGHVPPSTSNNLFFYASLCSYKSMKAISHVKRVREFAYHSYYN